MRKHIDIKDTYIEKQPISYMVVVTFLKQNLTIMNTQIELLLSIHNSNLVNKNLNQDNKLIGIAKTYALSILTLLLNQFIII